VRLSTTSVAASSELRAGPQTFQLVLGEAVGGRLTTGSGPVSIGRGVVGGLSFGRRFWSDDTGWFVLGTLSVSGSSIPTATGPLRALDVRVGVAAGKSIGAVTPYVLARAFGGPVWLPGGGVVGDDHHYVLGLGLSVRIARVDVGAELAPFGERRATGTVGLSF
jgi:hypothetical protein